MRKLFLLILLLPVGMFAQFSTVATAIINGTGLPATCQPLQGKVFFVKAGSGAGATGTPYYCSAVNTWTSMGGGVSGVTSVGGLTGVIGLGSGLTTSGLNLIVDTSAITPLYVTRDGTANTIGTFKVFTPTNTDGSLGIAPHNIPSALATGYFNMTLAGDTGIMGATNYGAFVRVDGSGIANPSFPGAGLATFAGSTFAVTSTTMGTGVLAFLTTPTSANLATAVTDELGSGKLIFSAGTLAVASGKTLTVSNTLTFIGTDSSSVAFGAGGTAVKIIAAGAKAVDFASTATGACATVITDTATGAASTDTIIFNANASIKAVTGYVPAATGGFSIAAYPTSNTVNFEGCNWTSGTVDPGSVTLNWLVIRSM